MRVAIVGGGVAGLAAAWGLAHGASVTLYEAAARLGGHTATVDIDYDGAPIAVDTGFIVYNTLNYPNLTAFFDHLGVETAPSDMSFSVSLGGGRLEWAGHERALWKLFAQPRNLLSPRFLRMLREVMRFNGVAVKDLKAGALDGLSLGEYLDRRGFAPQLRSDYLVPMGAAIWSTAAERMLDFPAESFVAFFDNHRLLSFDRPRWRTVAGGGRRYVERIARDLAGRVRLGAKVTRVERRHGQVLVHAGGETAAYDAVVLAAHADQALAMLSDASAQERAVLSAVRFADNDVWLHRDPGLMPRRRAAWSAWNYFSGEGAHASSVSVTYWMNALQGVDRSKPLFVSLNPPRPPRSESVFGRFAYAHPQLDAAALAAQRALPAIQGAGRVWFAGAWTGFGFHEDGLVSGIAAAEALGGAFPWRGRPAAPEPAAA
jgi:hypothetical protein